MAARRERPVRALIWEGSACRRRQRREDAEITLAGDACGTTGVGSPAGSTTYAHDDVGNITSRTGPDVPGGTQQIDYTAFDLPSKITGPNSEIDFAYDATGSRVVKQAPASTTFVSVRSAPFVTG